jgi:hypothetical protein
MSMEGKSSFHHSVGVTPRRTWPGSRFVITACPLA